MAKKRLQKKRSSSTIRKQESEILQVTTSKTEPVRVETSKVEPVKVETSKVEPLNWTFLLILLYIMNVFRNIMMS